MRWTPKQNKSNLAECLPTDSRPSTSLNSMLLKSSLLDQYQLKRNKPQQKTIPQKRTKASWKKTYPSSWLELIKLANKQMNIPMDLWSKTKDSLSSTDKEVSILSTFKGWTQKQTWGTVCSLTTKENPMMCLRYSNSQTHSVEISYHKELKGISLSSPWCKRARKKWQTDPLRWR